MVDRLATFNTERDLVAAQRAEIRAYADKRYGDALSYLFQIIGREPDQSRHWHKIIARYETYIHDDVALTDQLKRFLYTCLDAEPARISSRRGRAWAHGIRAYMFRRDSRSDRDCAEALQLADAEDQKLIGIVRFAQARSLALARHGAQHDLILDHLNAALDGLGPSAPVYIAKGDALRNMHRYEEAAASYDLAIDLPDAPFEVLTAAAKVYEHIGRYSEALKRYHAALPHTNDRDTFRRVSYLFASLGYFDRAIETIYRWMQVRPNGLVDVYATLVNVRLAEHKIDEAIQVIHDMESQRLWVSHSLRVSLAIRQRLFGDATRIAGESGSDARPYLRALAMVATGAEPAGVFNVEGPAEDLPPLALTAVLAGSPRARASLSRVMPDASSQSAKSRMIVAVADALAAAAEGSEGKLAEIINQTTENPEMALYLSNQLELRLTHDVCDGASQHIDPRVAVGMRRIFEEWENSNKAPTPSYAPLQLKRITGRGTDQLPPPPA